MQALSPAGRQAVAAIAGQHGISDEATCTMLAAVVAGQGTMAQFSHPELGGSGQWMRGGMTMVGDMFNSRLKSRVDALCSDLSTLLANRADLFERTPDGAVASANDATSRHGSWWPGELHSPNASGSQNGMRYAYFAGPRRLVVERDGRTCVFDTLDHRIGGVSQQQSSTRNLTFTSQHGPVDVDSLPVVSDGGRTSAPAAPDVPAHAPAASQPHPASQQGAFSALESLATLHGKGILTDAEYAEKKAEMLRRI